MNVSASATRTSLPSRTWNGAACPACIARAQAQERDAVTMPRIHVGLDLEHEPGQRLLERLTCLSRVARAGGPARAHEGASSSSTPKLLIAEPKNTGVCRPPR